MWAVSERFTRELTSEHEVTTQVLALVDGPGSTPVDISRFFAGGSLSVARQAIRRTGSLSFTIDPDDEINLLPRDASDLLAPYGQELIVRHGIAFGDGTEELVPQGVFRITFPRVRWPTVTVTLQDRAWAVSGARLEDTHVIAAGTRYTAAIREILELAWPPIEMALVDTGFTTPQIVLDAQADPWAEAQAMAEAIGYQLYFDRLGVCRLEPEPDHAGVDPVWSFDDASTEFIPRRDEHWFNLATHDMELTYDTEDTFNAWVVTGENTDNDTPFRGVARDNDPSSPTRWGGRFGKRTGFWSSPLITSDQQATTAAATRLQKQIGINEGLTIPLAAPHPALDVNDPVLVVRRELGINEVHVVDGFNMPLRASETQTITTRHRRVVLSNDA